MKLDSVEAYIRDEYNIIHAWIALHPYAAALVFFGLGVLTGWIFL